MNKYLCQKCGDWVNPGHVCTYHFILRFLAPFPSKRENLSIRKYFLIVEYLKHI